MTWLGVYRYGRYVRPTRAVVIRLNCFYDIAIQFAIKVLFGGKISISSRRLLISLLTATSPQFGHFSFVIPSEFLIPESSFPQFGQYRRVMFQRSPCIYLSPFPVSQEVCIRTTLLKAVGSSALWVNPSYLRPMK